MNKELLINLFNTDTDLLNKYHILAPASAEICAERTLNDLKDSMIFLIKDNNEIIGYYGISGSTLTGFFIKPDFRTKEIIIRFWNEVSSKFKKDFYCGLYNKNTKAIEFIRKKATQEYPLNNIDGIFFKIKR